MAYNRANFPDQHGRTNDNAYTHIQSYKVNVKNKSAKITLVTYVSQEAKANGFQPISTEVQKITSANYDAMFGKESTVMEGQGKMPQSLQSHTLSKFYTSLNEMENWSGDGITNHYEDELVNPADSVWVDYNLIATLLLSAYSEENLDAISLILDENFPSSGGGEQTLTVRLAEHKWRLFESIRVNDGVGLYFDGLIAHIGGLMVEIGGGEAAGGGEVVGEGVEVIEILNPIPDTTNAMTFVINGEGLTTVTTTMMDSFSDSWNGDVQAKFTNIITGEVYYIAIGPEFDIEVVSVQLPQGTYGIYMSGSNYTYSSENSMTVMFGEETLLEIPQGSFPTEPGDWVPTYVEILGCTDRKATNYNPDANVDDGSCVYEVIGEKEVGGGGEPILGCINPLACNYNSEATIDDGSCVFAEEGYDCNGEPL